ncbi:MAG: CoA ester lyase [Proteobacteria bacterium]|nr:CoA ester lyase [Pseudomonadota bacterium]
MLAGRDIRTVMFTPAHAIERLPRAFDSGADVCILDLEDSVGPGSKGQARESVCQYLNLPDQTRRGVSVRINPVDSPLGIEDLCALRSCATLPEFIIIPKCQSVVDVQMVDRMLAGHGRSIGLIALIETAAGVSHIDEIGRASAHLAALMFGSADYTRSISATICWDTLLFARTMIASVASQNNLGAIDTPYFDIPDIDGLIEETVRVKKLGFTGRCAIHPAQVGEINSLFLVSEEEEAKARRIVAAADSSQGNICAVDGQMVGAPIIAEARRMVLVAEQRKRRANLVG